MIKYVFLIILIWLFINSLSSQQVVSHNLESPYDINGYEFSSLRIRNDSIFTLSEGCNEIIVFSLKTKEFINSINNIAVTKKESDIEGFCLFHDLAFYTDEEDNSINLKYLKEEIDLKISQNLPIKIKQYSGNNCGLEGIEINPQGDYLYVLQESNSPAKKYSSIFCFNLKLDSDNRYTLKLDREIKIKTPEKQRYSDLTLSTDSKRLYLLRSKKEQYFIDTLPLDKLGKLSKDSYSSNELIFINISSVIKKYNLKRYSTNLEGITAYKNSLFIISDNYEGDGKCSHKVDLKTLLIEIKL